MKTFEEYCNQENPVRQQNVEIKESDCHSITPVHKGKIIVLVISGERYSYFVDWPLVYPNEGNRMYVMDNQGNKKSRSCFKFINQ